MVPKHWNRTWPDRPSLEPIYLTAYPITVIGSPNFGEIVWSVTTKESQLGFIFEVLHSQSMQTSQSLCLWRGWIFVS